ncbi:hypothetical protein [Streptomyces microflavus]|uniref:hypothetical protein n=1 Tax=Streptomyces microflavus TaxID=1919 RepID=UPI002E3774CD|nr:hypothetical protein [Streptomyces microflavus]
MGFRRTAEEKAAIKAMKAADAALDANGAKEQAAGIDYSTPAHQQLSGAANDAAAKVSRWRGGTRR